MDINIRNKQEAIDFVIFACFRHFGFAPHKNHIKIISYNNKRIAFVVNGKQYMITRFYDIPLVSKVDFYD